MASRWTAVLASLVLAGCGGGVTGTYTKEEKSPDGETLSISLELKGGDEAVFTMKGEGENLLSSAGSYAVDGDQVTVTIEGDAQVFTRDGDKLTGRVMGEDLVLVKE